MIHTLNRPFRTEVSGFECILLGELFLFCNFEVSKVGFSIVLCQEHS